MQSAKNEEIKQKISDFETHIDAYWAPLNTEGVWLFLAILGCWSVDHRSFQYFALAITVILFTNRIVSKVKDKRTFSKIRKDIENLIITDLEEGDTKKARLHDLTQIQTVKPSAKNTVKSTIIFILCYSFLIATYFHLWLTK